MLKFETELQKINLRGDRQDKYIIPDRRSQGHKKTINQHKGTNVEIEHKQLIFGYQSNYSRGFFSLNCSIIYSTNVF